MSKEIAAALGITPERDDVLCEISRVIRESAERSTDLIKMVLDRKDLSELEKMYVCYSIAWIEGMRRGSDTITVEIVKSEEED